MKHTYKDLIDQTYYFPQTSFRIEGNELYFHDIPLMEVIQRFGSPLKLTYLPKIREQIESARSLFRRAFQQQDYQGKYVFTYCTKSGHFAHILKAVLQQKAHLELSSAFDIDLILQLDQQGLVDKGMHIVCNGFKTANYFRKMKALIDAGFYRVMPVLDGKEELDEYLSWNVDYVNIGLRIANEEDPSFDLYTSRFGIRQGEVLNFYKEAIHENPKLRLRMLHSFVYTGIRDTAYYWNELHKFIKIYCSIRHLCPSLKSLNLGGGLPIQNSLAFEYDYDYMVGEIVAQIKGHSEEAHIPHPNIFSEFGSFTVGESSASIYQVIGQKKQNDRETWYLLDNSLITTLPDMWAEKQQFILLPINQWESSYQRVILGGLTCDNDDYFNQTSGQSEVYLPKFQPDNPLYIGFFHTGAYQEALSGYGGLKHCLIPTPQMILVDRDEQGQLHYRRFAEEQSATAQLKLLGYE